MGNRLYVGILSLDSSEDSVRAAFSADGRNIKVNEAKEREPRRGGGGGGGARW